MCDCGTDLIECIACINEICPEGCDKCFVCAFCNETFCADCQRYVCENCGCCSICQSDKLISVAENCENCDEKVELE